MQQGLGIENVVTIKRENSFNCLEIPQCSHYQTWGEWPQHGERKFQSIDIMKMRIKN